MIKNKLFGQSFTYKVVFVFFVLLIAVGFVFFLIKNFSAVKIKQGSGGQELLPSKKTMSDLTPNSKKILMVIAWRGFRDDEYFKPKRVFEENGFQVITASNQVGMAIGVNGGKAKVDISLDEINLNDYCAVVFSGGPKALDYLDSEKVYQIIQKAIQQEKVLGAICISPVILAKSGVLEKKRATVWSSPSYHRSIDILKEKGAIYLNQSVVRDGLIVTANGPAAAAEFGREIVQAVNNE